MPNPKFITRIDCRFFRGDVPCAPGAICEGCERYELMGRKILIIKLGAIGDVLRTTPVLPALRRANEPCHITWVVDASSAPLLKSNPHIDRLVIYGPEAIARVMVERFDVVYSLDKQPGAAALASLAKAPEKIGFVLDPDTGAIDFKGETAQYAYRLGLDDELKFKLNKKTYQQMTFEMMGFEWNREPYILEIPKHLREAGKGIINGLEFKGKGPVIGLVTGAGDVWPLKRWTVGGFAELADRLVMGKDARVMLLGAERDRARNIEIQAASKIKHPLAPHNMELTAFAGLIAECDCVVTGDTAAMHLGLALEIPTIVLFGPTAASEVEMYDTGRAIVAPVECAPCYKSACNRNTTCMDAISVDVVYKVINEIL